MNAAVPPFPRCRAVADHALLVEFGDVIAGEINDRVRALDAALSQQPFAGFAEAVPAYCSLLVVFDPIVTDHRLAETAVRGLIERASPTPPKGTTREVLVCYDSDLAPDLAQVAARTGLSTEAVIAAHLSGDYRVFMYGFAPGFAYLAGVPAAIRLPRKPAPVRGLPAGSVAIAGPQCLTSTLVMPTGWWVIGRSPTRILTDDSERPFLFDVGDAVVFRRIDRATFEREDRRG